jgi:hypothetical protein
VTFNAQGKPEVTMVWMDVEGDELLFNTAEGDGKEYKQTAFCQSLLKRKSEAKSEGLPRRFVF